MNIVPFFRFLIMMAPLIEFDTWVPSLVILASLGSGMGGAYKNSDLKTESTSLLPTLL